MQKHKILINNSFLTGATSIIDSRLLFINGYQVNAQSIGGGVVNEANVRNFLGDSRNDFIINDFFSYLTANTNSVEFRTIFYSDKKLSDVFNEYYNTSILSGIQTTTAIINQSLSGTSQNNYHSNIFNWDGFSPNVPMSGSVVSIINATRDSNVYSSLDSVSSENSYYISVFLPKNHQQTSRQRYDDLFPEILNKEILSSYTNSNLFLAVTGLTNSDNFIFRNSYISNLIH